MKNNHSTPQTFSYQSKALILLVSTLLALTLDQVSKYLAVEYLKHYPAHQFLNGTIKFIYAENRGAWGSLGGNWPEGLRLTFLVALPAVILLGVAIYILINRHIKKIEVISLSLIVAGGLGNLIDRIRFGYVVDMFWIGIPETIWQTNIFNIADVVIMIGFCTLFIANILDWKREKNRGS